MSKRTEERKPKLMFVVLELLEKTGPSSCAELGALLGMSREATRNHVRDLTLLNPKVVYIHSWKPALGYGKGSGGPIWAAGDLPDAKQPPKAGRRPPAVRPEDDGYLERQMRADARKAAKTIQPFRHWQDAALFGEARA